MSHTLYYAARCASLFPCSRQAVKTGFVPERWLLLQPNTTFKAAWDWLLVGLVVVSAVTVPLEISFAADFPTTDALVDVVFWLDIVITLNTSFTDYWGIIISSRR